MIVHDYLVDNCNRSDLYYLIPIGDEHIGSRNCDEKKLQNIIDYINDRENVLWIGTGDACEYINYLDKRFDPDNVHPRFANKLSNLHLEQARYFKRLFKPIAHKCIGMLSGNHEESIKKKFGMDVHNWLCMELNVKDLSDTCFVRLRFRRKIHTKHNNGARVVMIYATHGHGANRTTAGKITKITQKGAQFEADIYLMGHVHGKTSTTEVVLYMSKRGEPRLRERKKIYGVCGTFLKTYQENVSNYAQRSGYPPTATGVVKISIEPFPHIRENGAHVELPPNLHISE